MKVARENTMRVNGLRLTKEEEDKADRIAQRECRTRAALMRHVFVGWLNKQKA